MTMPDETQRRPRILISITSTQSEKLLKKCFDTLRIPIFYQCRAQGTAPSEILDILGMRESARLITVSFLPRFSVPAVFEAMENELSVKRRGSGIVFTVPVTGIQTPIFSMLNEEAKEKIEKRIEGDEAKMKDMFGITVKVANPDNTKLASSNMTIAAAGRETVATDDWSNEQLQCYFWDTLQDLLIAKGYDIEKKDFAQDVADYYKSTRYKRYGVTFNIYRTKKGKDVTFTIYALEKYVYGIKYSGDVTKDKVLEEAINGVSPLISLNENWAGFGGPSSRYELNFKKMDSEGIGKLKNPASRAAFMNGLVNEMDALIKKLVESFKKKGL